MTPKILTGLIFFIAVLAYAGYQLTGLVQGPQLNIREPANGATLTEELLTLRGQAVGLNKVQVNGEKLDLPEGGELETKLLLAEGYNTIRLTGEDRFGRIIKQKLQLVYRPSASTTIYD